MRSPLLGPAEIRELAAQYGLRPTKARGQNFLHDANTIRRIVRLAELRPGECVLEVGPGLGSLTVGLLDAGHPVLAVELDPLLGAVLGQTVAERLPDAAGRLRVLIADAAKLRAGDLGAAGHELASGAGGEVTALVANLPYNAAVPILLNALSEVASIQHGLIMVQAEVAQRLTAQPGSKVYGVPSVKLAWFAAAHRAGMIGRGVFWPAPRVDSELVAFRRREPPAGADRAEVFTVIDAAFAQRRKMLRTGLARWAGSATAAEAVLRAAGVDPGARGEMLGLAQFVDIAAAGRRE